jgi:hypothetical protein
MFSLLGLVLLAMFIGSLFKVCRAGAFRKPDSVFGSLSFGLMGVVFLTMGLCAIAGLLINNEARGVEAPASSGNFKNPDAVQRVLSGKETVANAAWWGFNAVDSTEAIQGAINSGAAKVIIPYMGKEWVVQPIKLTSNQEVIFEPGVVVTAKKGDFKDRFDCLFSARNLSNVTLQGYGATLRMRKDDYKSLQYIKSEHRHVLELMSSSNINILGLRFASSGGDGIFITRDEHFLPCKNILIRDCICDDNYRQGISVISVDKLRIENCVLKNTMGTSPSAGIDLEPDDAVDMLVDVVISNCISENNAGSGFIASVGSLSEKSREVSVLFVNCYARNCAAPGLRFRSVSKYTDNDPNGLIEFKNCTCENISYAGSYAIWGKVNSSLKLRFSDCKWQNVAKIPKEFPIYLDLKRKGTVSRTGGVEFVNCYVYDEKDRPFMRITDVEAGKGVFDVTGEINICNPYGAKMNLGTSGEKLALKVNSFRIQE